MNHDDTVKRLLEEMKPELDRQWAEHERFMGLLANVANGPNATDEQKRAFHEHLRKRALGPPKRKFPYIGVGILFLIVILTVLIFGALRTAFFS